MKLPWISEAEKVLGLHEVRDNKALSAWLKSDGKALGNPSKMPWCFTGETEIMTEEGWQRLDALTAARVYQVDEDGELSLTHYAPVRKQFRGRLNVVNHRSFTLRCDPEHRWWGNWGFSGRSKRLKPLAFGVLSDLTTAGLSIPACQSGAAGTGLTADQLTLIAAVLSDGTPRRRANGTVREFVFEVSKDRKIAALTSLGPDHCYTQRMAYGELTTKPLTVFTFKAHPWLLAAVDDRKEMTRDFVNGLTQAEARAFLSAYRVFDGQMGKFHLYTSSQQRIDDLSQIAVMAGFKYGVSIKKSPLSDRECFEMHIRDDGTPHFMRPQHISHEDFDGDLFCVTVPQGRIVVRERNRGAVVTGNCGDFVDTALARALPKEPRPGALGVNPYWARNWDLLGVPSPLVYGAVVTFQRPGGGHVGFLVGISPDGAYYLVLGGNQSNRVSRTWIAKSRCKAVRWPATYANPRTPLPVVKKTGAASKNEA